MGSLDIAVFHMSTVQYNLPRAGRGPELIVSCLNSFAYSPAPGPPDSQVQSQVLQTLRREMTCIKYKSFSWCMYSGQAGHISHSFPLFRLVSLSSLSNPVIASKSL